MSRHGPWVESAVANEWVAKMRGYGGGRLCAPLETYYRKLRWLDPEYDTGLGRTRVCEIREELGRWGEVLRCTWTGRPLRDHLEVDHCLPFRAWPCNDLWNLVPSLPSVNGSKGDRLPSARALRDAKQRLLG